MKRKMDRREFLGTATFTALALPAILQGGSKIGQAAEATKEGKTKMKRICVEEHWGNSDMDEMREIWGKKTGYVSRQDPKSQTSIYSKSRTADFEKFRLPEMDEAGITMQVLSTSSPGIQGLPDGPLAIVMAKKVNDAQAQIISRYPGRFAGFATLPTQDPKAAADELERAVAQLGFRGAMIHGHTYGEYLDDQKFRVLWERSEALRAPIYMHVAGPLGATKNYEGRPELTGAMWSYVVETATHALRIILSGMFDAYPKATLILGHLGEALPYLLGRLDEGYAMAVKSTKLKKSPSEYVKDNIVITTSGKYKPEALLCAINAMGADRILFAADYPYVSIKEAVECLENSPISDSDKEKIYHLNAERLLRL
jgi:2,3-dihydroxybenzoate decarboxylase